MKLYWLFTTLLLANASFSQVTNFNFGARSAGMANASSTMGDAYSLFNNVGGLGRVEQSSVFAGYQNRYGIPEFQVLGAGAVYHTSVGVAGVGFHKVGDELFSQQRLTLAISNQFQMVSLGLGVDLFQYDIATIGTRQVVSIQFGGVAEITKNLRFAAHLLNLNQAKISKETSETVPTVMKAAISYLPTEELQLTMEVEKDLDYNEVIKVGLEYQVIEHVFFRTGISTQPFISSFGLGFHPNRLQFDYSFSRDSALGAIHDLSLAYSFNK